MAGMSDRKTDDPSTAPALAVGPCQSVCTWRATGATWSTVRGDALTLFACAGCGSEWVRTEAWTPIDAQGTVPPAVAEERRRPA